MTIFIQPKLLSLMLLLPGLLWASSLSAKPEPDACIELGALAWDDWTSIDGGGSGLPAGESTRDYLRCKSCHGWDRLGENGGYVRRTRTAERPNAGLGDTDTRTRDIAPGMGDYYHVRAEEVLHEGTGRAYEDGSASWVVIDGQSDAQARADHAAGYTLGNQHPDFAVTGANAGDVVLTQDQLDCLVDFINFGDADPKFYFFGIDTDANPVQYGIHPGASATAGRTFYVVNCLVCHGEPVEDFQGANNGKPQGGILSFLAGDGAYSAFVHKARWGIPDSVMTRETIGTPDSQDMIDVMLYLQEMLADDFLVSGGIAGSWWNPDRSGEGFQVDIGADGIVVVAFYTYDTQGNQIWLWGSGTYLEDRIIVDAYLTDGALYGESFDPLAVNRYLWGTITLSFETCYTAWAELLPKPEFATEFEAMTIPITRLIDPLNCQGGEASSLQ